MNEIDDIFRKKLNNNGLDYKQVYWDSMEDLLRKKKRRAVYISFAVLAVLFTVAGTAYVLWNPNKEQMLTVNEPRVLVKPDLEQNAKLEETIPELANSESETNKQNKAYQPLEPAMPEKIKREESRPQMQDSKPSGENAGGQILPQNAVQQSEQESTSDLLRVHEIQDGTERYLLYSSYTRFNPYLLFPLFALTAETTAVPLPALKPAAVNKTEVPWTFYLGSGFDYNIYKREALEALHKNEEKTRNSFGYNLNFSARKKHFGIKTGLGILQLREQSSYSSTYNRYTYDTSYRMVNPNYLLSPGGKRIALIKREIDTTVFIETEVKDPNSRIEFTYLKLPLYATYEIALKPFSIYLDAGLNTSFLVQKRGAYTRFDGQKFQVYPSEEKADLNKVLLQSYTSLGLRLPFSKMGNVYASYGFSTALNSMTRSYTQKPVLHVFALGLEYKL